MDQYWCSTKTNTDGEHIEGQWGLCGEQCPKIIFGKTNLSIDCTMFYDIGTVLYVSINKCQNKIDKIISIQIKHYLLIWYHIAEIGWCLDENGKDQNDGLVHLWTGVVNLFDFIGAACFKRCLEEWRNGKATGCEFYSDNLYEKCHYHTKTVSKGSVGPHGDSKDKYLCWVFPPHGKLDTLMVYEFQILFNQK